MTNAIQSKTLHPLLVRVILLVSALFVPNFVSAQDSVTAKLIEGARKEGRMIFYSSLNVEDNNGLLRKFEEKYPFIKTELNRLSADRLLIRFQSEARAKKHVADVLLNGGARTYITKKEGLLMKYVSPESKFYGPGFKDPDGYWTDAYLNAHVLVYNTRMVKAPDVPRSHADLLKPQWTGKFVMVSKAYEWFLKILKLGGEEKGLEFFKQLALQKPGFRIGSSQIADLVAAGEHPIGINTYSTNIEDLKARGAPVEWVPLGPGDRDPSPPGDQRQRPSSQRGKAFRRLCAVERRDAAPAQLQKNSQPARCRADRPAADQGYQVPSQRARACGGIRQVRAHIPKYLRGKMSGIVLVSRARA